MTYAIGDVAEKFNLSISTIRYYDKRGLLPFVSKNKSGHRAFTDSDLKMLYTVCCLKDTGMSIEHIRDYISAVMAGDTTIDDRIAMLKDHRETILRQQAVLQESLAEIDLKLENYQAPDAHTFVQKEVAYVNQEKARAGLKKPFQVKR